MIWIELYRGYLARGLSESLAAKMADALVSRS